MPVPTPRTPICVARGNKGDLIANLAALQEGEVCYAFDEDALYVKELGILKKIGTVSAVAVTGPLQVSNVNPAVPRLTVASASSTQEGVVRWADAAAVAAGTAGRAVDAAQLRQMKLPNGTQLLDLLQWNGTAWIADRRLDGGNF